MRYVNHQFYPSHTISAAVRLYNGVTTSAEDMSKLYAQFNELNPDLIVKIGTIAKIPLLENAAPENVEILDSDNK
jgi:hypothetical protein